METLWQDLRYAVRILMKNPGFAMVAVLTLALGIGANTAIFSVVHAVLLKSLPYPDPDRLVWFQPASLRTGEPEEGAISPSDFQDYRERSTLFEHITAFLQNPVNSTGAGPAERVPAATVSYDFFDTLGVKPLYGRTFRPEDEKVAAPQVAVISYGLWQSHFGADPGLVGKAITLDDRSTTVVGILPRGFQFPKEAELWRPLPFQNPSLNVRRLRFVQVVGQLKPGVRLAQAQSEITGICLRLERQYPDSNTDSGAKLLRLQERIVGNLKATLTMLMAAVGFVLLIACVNIANLLLARAASREKEIAIRTALGAHALRVVRQLLTESVLLAVLGGALGLLLASAGIRALVLLNPENIPRLNEVHLNPTVLGFTVVLSFLTGLTFGIVPALRTARVDLVEALKEGSRGTSAGFSSQMFRRVLVVVEVAVAFVLLIGAGLLMRSFARLQNVKPGFNPAGVLTVQVYLPFKGIQDSSQWAEFFRQLLARIEGLPGVQYAGVVSELPLSGQENETTFTIEGQPPPAGGTKPYVNQRRVSPDYFKAMGIPLLKGRYFTDLDNQAAPKVIIISESFAHRFFTDQDPVGRRLAIDFGQAWTGEIVGVVGTIHHTSLAQAPGRELYVPEPQSPFNGLNLVIRAATSPSPLATAVKEQVWAMDATVPVYQIRTMDQLVSESLAPPRFHTVLMGIFAGVALVLAVAGIYGVMSHSVSRRTHEIGIRMALGAQPRDVLGLVVRQGMAPALVGGGIGLLGSFGLARLLTALLFEVSATDPITFVCVGVLLSLVALVACYVPARRATRVEPMAALRYE